MKKLYEWKVIEGRHLIDPPPVGPYYDCVELDGQYETEDQAVADAERYKKAGGFGDLVLLTIFEI